MKNVAKSVATLKFGFKPKMGVDFRYSYIRGRYSILSQGYQFERISKDISDLAGIL